MKKCDWKVRWGVDDIWNATASRANLNVNNSIWQNVWERLESRRTIEFVFRNALENHEEN